MGTTWQRASRIAPGAVGVADRRAEQRRAFEYGHRAVGLGRASQQHLIRIYNRVARDDWSIWCYRINGYSQHTRGSAGVTC